MIHPPIRRELGTMIVYGYRHAPLAGELTLVQRLGAAVLEILPLWRDLPDPRPLASAVADAGLKVHSAHGCWGGQTIRAAQVDLGSLDPATRLASVDDIRRCLAWLREAGGSTLVVHPGGLADPADQKSRQAALIDSLQALAPDAESSRIVVAVENMPPGVYPGTSMADLAAVVAKVDSPAVALALDTGHALIAEASSGAADSPELASTTRDAGRWLVTTHVHDNDARRDLHWPPGLGRVDWDAWVRHLDAIDYRGPIVLECIRHLRDQPESIDDALLGRLARLTGLDRV